MAANPAPWWRTPTALIAGGVAAALVLGVGGGLIGGVIVGSAQRAGACDAIAVTETALPSIVTVWASGPQGAGNGSGWGAYPRARRTGITVPSTTRTTESS